MKNHASGHGRKGNAGYRTPSTFRFETVRRAKIDRLQTKDAPRWKGRSEKGPA